MASYITEKDKLTGEYKEIFAKVETYAILLGVENQIQEDMLMNLEDILYTAQLEEKPAAQIIGNDVEQFCKDYFQEQRGILGAIRGIPGWLYRVSVVVLIFGILEIVFCAGESAVQIWTATMDISGFLVGLLAGGITSCIALWVISPLLFRLKKVNATVIAFLVLIIDFSLIVVGVMEFGEETLSVPMLPVVSVSAVFVIVFKSYQMYQRYQKTGTIKKPKKNGTLREIYRDTQRAEIPKQLKKRLEKINKRRKKRGRPEMSREDFTRKVQKEYKFLGIAVLVLYVGVWAGSTISDAMQGQWWPDTVVLAGMLAVCYRLFSPKYMLKLLKQCEKQNADVIEMAERMAEGRYSS